MSIDNMTMRREPTAALPGPIRVASANRPADDRDLAEWLLGRAAMDGHTALPKSLVIAGLAGCGVVDPARLLANTLAVGAVRDLDDRSMLALTPLAAAEEAVADNLRRLIRRGRPLCEPDSQPPHSTDLDPAQAAALLIAVKVPVSVVLGTSTDLLPMLAALQQLVAACGRRTVLATPTAQVAKQLLNALTDATVSTVPALLQSKRPESLFDADFEFGLVAVTNAAMLDVPSAAALLELLPDDAHLVLIGDPAQLPPAGPGAFFGDLVASGGVPVTDLTAEHHRDGSGAALVRLAAEIRAGRLPAVDAPDREIVLVPATDSSQTMRRVTQLVTDSIPRALGIATKDVQVLTPLRRGSAGSAALNAALKEQLNPGSGVHGGFDIGDRVAAIRSVPETGLARGDVGVVTGASGSDLRVELATGPVDCPAAHLDALAHGWAVTASVGQGSRWPAVVAVLPGEAAGSLSRPLVYTMMSRAERHLSVVHGAGPALPRAVAAVPARSRWTRLPALLREQS